MRISPTLLGLADDLQAATDAANARPTENTYLGPLSNKYALFHLARADKVVNATAGAMGQRLRQLQAHVESNDYLAPTQRLLNAYGAADRIVRVVKQAEYSAPTDVAADALLLAKAWVGISNAEVQSYVPHPSELKEPTPAAEAERLLAEPTGAAAAEAVISGRLRWVVFAASDEATAASQTAYDLYRSALNLRVQLRAYEDAYAAYYEQCLGMYRRKELVLPFNLDERLAQVAALYRSDQGILTPCTPWTTIALYNFHASLDQKAQQFNYERLMYAESTWHREGAVDEAAYRAYLDQSAAELQTWVAAQCRAFNEQYEPKALEALAGRLCANHGFFIDPAVAERIAHVAPVEPT